MSFNVRGLCLVHSKYLSSDGESKHSLGTGYFVTSDLVLTASHVLKTLKAKTLKVRIEGDQVWKSAHLKPVWINEDIDAALIKVVEPISDIVPPSWGETFAATENVRWSTTAYPVASSTFDGKSSTSSTSGLKGTWYVQGGRGQGPRHLELGVDDPTTPEEWQGISGAPVFVANKLVGIIKTVRPSFKGGRLLGVPAEQLLQDPHFQVAIAQEWLEPFPLENIWFLVLVSENGSSVATATIEAAIRNFVNSTTHKNNRSSVKNKPYIVSINEVLESPGRWLQFVKALCRAPVMIAEISEFAKEPGIMLSLGIRSAVRRGVTVTVTSKEIRESELSALPFNIQETKLISLSSMTGDRRRTAKKSEPIDQIGDVIAKGIVELRDYTEYLDLPAYLATRCPKPSDEEVQNKDNSDGSITAMNSILMLCSFHKKYDNHWNYVFGHIQNEAAVTVDESLTKPVSMVDIASPRLVGQSLYERIRWSPCCFIDWTHWRPNVFFEFGVRLATSNIGPICAIESNSKPNTRTASRQKKQLMELFSPIVYSLRDKKGRPFKETFERFNEIINRRDIPLSPLAHDATFKTIVECYDWEQERVTWLPHEVIQFGIESELGEDPQKDGSESTILFSSNREFANELRRNVQERWIAAWFYFRDRFLISDFATPELAKWEELPDERRIELTKQFVISIKELNPKHRDYLENIIESVAQSLSKSGDEFHKKIGIELGVLQDVIDDIKFSPEGDQID